MEDKLPEGWKIKKMVEHVPIVKTGVKEYKGKRPYYSTGVIDSTSISPEGYYAFENKPARANRLVIKDDVIQARMQGTKKALIIDDILGESLLSTGFLQFRPLEQNYDPKLFYHYLCSDLFLKQRDEFASGSTQIALTDKGARKIDLIVPPADQQKRITDKLDVLLAKVKDAQSRLDKIPLILKYLKQSIYVNATRPRNSDWEKYTLESLCDFVGGGTPTRNKNNYWNGDVPWVSPKDMKRDRIDSSIEYISSEGLNKSSAKLIPKGSILLVVRGMILNHTLPVAITEKPVAVNQDMKALIPKDQSYTEYLFWACKAAALQILFYVKEATHGTRRIETDLLKQWKIFIPPREIVRDVIKNIQKNLRVIDDLEKRFLKTAQYTDKLEQSILAKAFQGELVR